MIIAFFFPPGRWWFNFGTSLPAPEGIPAAKTKEALERKGVKVLQFDPWERDQKFDILHVFGASYTMERFIRLAKTHGVPVVVTANDYSAKPLWKWRLARLTDRFIPIPTTYHMRQTIYNVADRIICSSQSEARQLSQRFRIDSSKVRIVPHGIDKEIFANADPKLFVERFGLKDFILEVARINRRKGQCRLIRALEGTGLEVVFIGPLGSTTAGKFGDQEEYEEFLDLVDKYPWVHYLGEISHEDPLLPSAYAAAKVHALPSTYEFPGMVTIEACAAGTAAVSGRYPTIYDYFGNRIRYCNPLDITSIRRSVLQAYQEGAYPGIKEYTLKNFSWDHIAESLLKIYEELLQ